VDPDSIEEGNAILDAFINHDIENDNEGENKYVEDTGNLFVDVSG
jgi:hypothetical protein